ncbi:MAG: SgcJ/EcaC family oxidoreductase [Thermoanaerobaculia bacterium]
MAATADETAIRKIIQDEVAAWNRGDATAYSRQFATDGTFTNIRGQFFTGYDAFLKQHEVIFQTLFKNSTLRQEIVSLKFIGPNVVVVETLNSVSGMPATSPGTAADSKGRLRTRLLQVVARQDGEWKIVAYHNVDVKPGVPVPEPM